MRDPSLLRSWWNRTSCWLTALNNLTGTLTSPKEIEPLQMGLGTAHHATQRYGASSERVDHDVVGGDVGAEAHEDGVAQGARGRDLGERDLRDEDRLQILHPGRRRAGERAVAAGSARQRAPECLDVRPGSAPIRPCPTKSSAVRRRGVPHPEGQRSEPAGP